MDTTLKQGFFGAPPLVNSKVLSVDWQAFDSCLIISSDFMELVSSVGKSNNHCLLHCLLPWDKSIGVPTGMQQKTIYCLQNVKDTP